MKFILKNLIKFFSDFWIPLLETPYAKYFPLSENFLVFKAAVPSSEKVFGSKKTVASSFKDFYI